MPTAHPADCCEPAAPLDGSSAGPEGPPFSLLFLCQTAAPSSPRWPAFDPLAPRHPDQRSCCSSQDVSCTPQKRAAGEAGARLPAPQTSGPAPPVPTCEGIKIKVPKSFLPWAGPELGKALCPSADQFWAKSQPTLPRRFGVHSSLEAAVLSVAQPWTGNGEALAKPPASPSPKPSDLLFGLCCSLPLGTLPGCRLGAALGLVFVQSPWLLHSSPVRTEHPRGVPGFPTGNSAEQWHHAGLNQTKEGAQASDLTLLRQRLLGAASGLAPSSASGPPGCCASYTTLTSCLCLCADLTDAVSVQRENQAGRRPRARPVPMSSPFPLHACCRRCWLGRLAHTRLLQLPGPWKIPGLACNSLPTATAPRTCWLSEAQRWVSLRAWVFPRDDQHWTSLRAQGLGQLHWLQSRSRRGPHCLVRGGAGVVLAGAHPAATHQRRPEAPVLPCCRVGPGLQTGCS